MTEEIENFIYKHSSPNGCVALTRMERDELFDMIEQFQTSCLEKGNADLKAQKFELEVQLQDVTTQRNLADEQVETLEEELQSERYNLKCRDDELAEMKAKLRRAETKMRLAAEDYFEATNRVPGYFQALEERARKQEDLEDECAEDKAAAIRQEKEDGLLD